MANTGFDALVKGDIPHKITTQGDPAMQIPHSHTLFGNWQIKAELGRGQYGTVYELHRQDFGVTYTSALKAITIPQSQNEINSIRADGMSEPSVATYYRQIAEEIVNEIALMSKLKGHSNIVSYEDHMLIPHDDKIGWDILIRMELLTPLINHVHTNYLTQNEVVKLGLDLCRALEVCQKHNILHRDIKPENIFISANSDYKLGDFGIARTIEKTTAALSKKGTFTYMAPEIYMGGGYGSTVDVYSLGLVMYWLLNESRTPFLPPYPAPITPSDRETANIRRIHGEPLPPPTKADRRLAEIVLKMCAHNPKDRYDSMPLLRADLESILHTSGVIKSTPAINQTAMLSQMHQQREMTIHLSSLFDNPSMKCLSEAPAPSVAPLPEPTMTGRGKSTTQPPTVITPLQVSLTRFIGMASAICLALASWNFLRAFIFQLNLTNDGYPGTRRGIDAVIWLGFNFFAFVAITLTEITEYKHKKSGYVAFDDRSQTNLPVNKKTTGNTIKGIAAAFFGLSIVQAALAVLYLRPIYSPGPGLFSIFYFTSRGGTEIVWLAGLALLILSFILLGICYIWCEAMQVVLPVTIFGIASVVFSLLSWLAVYIKYGLVFPGRFLGVFQILGILGFIIWVGLWFIVAHLAYRKR